MTRIRRLAIVLLTASVVTSAIYATGAFTSITAQRDANIQVAGDAASYLSIKPASGQNGEYATLTGGKLHVTVGSALDGNGGGVNKNAITSVRNIFTITNQGTQPLGVWVSDTSKAVSFKGGTKWKELEGRKNAVSLNPGETLYVGLTVDTRGKTKGDLISSMTIHANSDISGADVKTGPTKPARDKSGATTTTTPRSPSNKDDSSSSNSKGDKNDDKSSKKNKSKSGDSKSDSASKDDSSTLENVGRAVKALGLGFTLGNLGMPGGWMSVKESSSPFYLIGQLLNAIAPWGLDMVFDLRDLVANAASGKLMSWGSLLNAVGLLPVLGSFEDVSDLVKITKKWKNAFPSSADDVVKFLSNAIIKHLPGGLGAKLLDVVSDAPVSKLKGEGMSVDQIIKYQNKGVDLQRVLELRKKDIPASDIQMYVDKGIPLKRVTELRNAGRTPRSIKTSLMDTNFKKLESQGISNQRAMDYLKKGVDLDYVSELRSKGVPKEDIKFYVDNNIGLEGPKIAIDKGLSPETTKELFKRIHQVNEADKYKKISEKELEKIRITIGGTQRISDRLVTLAASYVNYDGWKDARQDSQTRKRNGPTRRSIRGQYGEIHLQ